MPDIKKLEGAIPELAQEQMFEGEWDFVSNHMGCCDCGLVHEMEYRVVNLETKTAFSVPALAEVGMAIQVRAFRDPELTKKARESQNFTCRLNPKGGEKNESGKFESCV